MAKKNKNTEPMTANKEEIKALEGQLQTLSVQLSRALLGTALGKTFDGDRDIYTVLGYKSSPCFEDYLAKYDRQDIAARIIEAPSNGTWSGQAKITENEEEATDFDNAVVSLVDRLALWQTFNRADKLAGIGRYGVLLLGFDDVKDHKDLKEEVKKGGDRKLLYVQPYTEASCTIKTWNNDAASADYGKPLTYQITFNPQDGNNNGSQGQVQTTLHVHHSRVVHLAEGLRENEVYGTPRLKNVFNRLQDLEKIVGGSAEMFWKGARPGYQALLDAESTLSDDAKADIKNQLDEFEHKLRRVLTLQGVEMKGLDSQVQDPTPHVNVQLQMISAATGIPLRILTGSERGELASTQDDSNWKTVIHERRIDYAEPQIVRPFVDRLIKYGVLPEPADGYSVEWPDLFSLSKKEQSEIAKNYTEALGKYAGSPGADIIVPPAEFLEYFLNMTPDQVQKIEDAREGAFDDMEEGEEFEGQEQ